MEYLPPLETPIQSEKEKIQSDVEEYVMGLRQAFGLTGLSEKQADLTYDIYKKANVAGDILFGSRENAGVRMVGFAEEGRKRFKDTDELREALNKYQSNLSLLKTDLVGKTGAGVDKLREETVDLQKNLIGEGINRIIF